MTSRSSSGTGRVFGTAQRAVDRLAERSIPDRLQARWADASDVVSDDATKRELFAGRLHRDRRSIIPWLDAHQTLDGASILEVGSGPGASTVALTEQGASVTTVDVEDATLDRARRACAAHGVSAEFVCANAADLDTTFAGRRFASVIFWASLEHMTLEERLAALAGAWQLIEPGGHLTMIETPNRLWFHDSHTSKLPFFNWLPDELAIRYAHHSPRPGFGDAYDRPDEQLLDFRRRGRGVSYHDVDVAIGPAWRDVASCMQLERRRRQPARRAGWRASRPGRYEALLASVAPDVPAAWLQPFLYLSLQRP